MMLEAVSSILKGASDLAQSSGVARSRLRLSRRWGRRRRAVNRRSASTACCKQVANDAISTMKTGEAASISGIQGKESTQSVVEALMSAEQTLQMAVAVRDKVVQAYQEVSRMSI